MSNAKISSLTPITGANTAAADLFLVVDVSDTTMAPSGTDKTLTRDELAVAVNAANAAHPLTVSTLPTGVTGLRAYVTDATSPTFLATLVGGGTVRTPAFYDGTHWVAG